MHPSAAKSVPLAKIDYLLIDISNSFTKIAYASRKRVGRPFRMPTHKLTASVLKKIVAARAIGTIVVSSVVPSRNELVRAAAGKVAFFFLSWKSTLNVRIDYPNPKTIGADRLANAVAVTALYGSPAIVIDFGTAVTFDIVSADRSYIGGVIAPGLEAMTNFLYDRTALLPRISLGEPRRAVGKSTYEARVAGAILGDRGLVREILGLIVREQFQNKRLHVVATGGYAKLIARQLAEVEAVHENLTLEGLRLVGGMNGRL